MHNTARAMDVRAGTVLFLMVVSCVGGQYNAWHYRDDTTQEEQKSAPEPVAPVTPAASAAPAAQPAPAPKDAALEAVANASNIFSKDFFQKVLSESGNLVVSPLSVGSVLTLAWSGAGGSTKQQLQQVLHLPDDFQQVEEGLRVFYRTLKSSRDGPSLDADNRVFVRRDLGLKPEFQSRASDVFQAGAEELDFANPVEAAAAVNGWVREKTRGKIEELVKPDSFSDSTSMVLANALYFKGTWRTQFDPSRTVTKPFRSNPPRNVPLMSTAGDFPHAHLPDLRAQALLLPYEGESVSMLVLLPYAVDGLPALESALASVDVKNIVKELVTEEMYVWLPRFRIQSSLNLNDALVQMGLSDLFGSKADFSGIADNGTYLSSVVQKAVIEVSEEGTEAAAASGGILLLIADMSNFFRADHPFVFYLLDRRTDTILFQGRFVGPE